MRRKNKTKLVFDGIGQYAFSIDNDVKNMMKVTVSKIN